MLTLSQSSVFVLLKHLSHHAPPPAWLTDLGMTMKMKVKRRMNCRADRFVWTLSLLLDWSAGSMMTGGEAQTDGDKCPDLYAHTHTHTTRAHARSRLQVWPIYSKLSAGLCCVQCRFITSVWRLLLLEIGTGASVAHTLYKLDEHTPTRAHCFPSPFSNECLCFVDCR